MIALEEANRIAAILERNPAFGQPRLPLDPRVRQTLDLDLRIALDWDTDLTDIDLWVTEPSSEKCFYGHALTAQGGHMSRDFTGGYGPEIYGAHRAQAGDYRIQANFYGSRAQQLTGAVTVQALVITNFARPNEKREAMTLRLAQSREVVEIGVAKFGGVSGVTP